MKYFGKIPLYLIILYAIVFICSVVLAFFALFKQLTFGFDQARDAYEAFAIWYNHDFKILGPSSDLPGIHHGALWYYLLVLPYVIGFGNPQVVAIIFFIISFLTVPLCAYLAYKFFHNFHFALLASVLYVSSPLFQTFTRWLSNPLIALYVTPFLLFFLWKYINENKKVNSQSKYAIGWAGLLFGLLIQADFAFGIFLITLPIYWFIYKIRIKLQDFLFFGIGLLLGLSTYIIAEVRFNGKAVLAVMNFLNSSLFSPRPLMETISLIAERINEFLFISVIPYSYPYAIIFFIAIISIFFLKYYKNEQSRSPIFLLLVWLSIFIIFHLFKSGFLKSGFMFAPFLIPITIVWSYLLINVIKNYKLLAIFLISIFISQFYTSYLWLKTEYNPSSVQYGISLSLEKEIIRYTYEQSKGERFIIITITNPLDINTMWAYLYETYGQKKYGYLPYYSGKSQAGYLGNLPERQFGTKYRYVIVEPTTGIQDFFIEQVMLGENKSSDIVEEKKFGQFLVQKRIFRKNEYSID